MAYTYDAHGRLLSRSSNSLFLMDDFSSGIGSWQTTSGSWSVVSDNGNQVLKGDGLAAATAARNDTRYYGGYITLTARVKVTSTDAASGNAGLVFRSDIPQGGSADGYEYYLGIYPGESFWKLWKVRGGNFGSPVHLGYHAFELNRYYTLQVQLKINGEYMSIIIDGEGVGAYEDASPIYASNVGLRAQDAAAYFDDLRADGSYYNITHFRLSEATGDLLHQLDAQGNILVTYIQDEDGQIVAEQRGANLYFYHYNTHGDVIALTDAQGNTVARFSYDAWGVPTEYKLISGSWQATQIGAWAGTPNSGVFFLFAGMLYDAAAGPCCLI